MTNNCRTLLNSFAKKAELDQVRRILRNIPNIGLGEREIYWERLVNKNDKSALFPLLETLVKSQEEGYSTLIFPTIISSGRAPNFYLAGEREAPQEEEAWKTLYLLLTSVQFRDTLLNLDNVAEEGRRDWRLKLMPESASASFKMIISELELRSRNIGPFFLSLLAIAYWVRRVKLSISGPSKSRGILQKEWIDKLKEKYGFRDDTVLVVFRMGRGKKEVHYFGALSQFIIKWFKEYIEGGEQRQSLITFLDSLTSISSNRTNAELVSEVREKFVFHLLKYHEINGELLAQLVELRVQDTLNSKKPFGVMSAQDFFARLT